MVLLKRVDSWPWVGIWQWHAALPKLSSSLSSFLPPFPRVSFPLRLRRVCFTSGIANGEGRLITPVAFSSSSTRHCRHGHEHLGFENDERSVSSSPSLGATSVWARNPNMRESNSGIARTRWDAGGACAGWTRSFEELNVLRALLLFENELGIAGDESRRWWFHPS